MSKQEDKTNKMVEGLLFEGSAEKTVILWCIESIMNIPMGVLLEDENVERVGDMVNQLWTDNKTWEEFDSRIAEAVRELNIKIR